MRDQVAGREHGLALRCVARQQVEIGERNCPLAFRSTYVNDRFERSQGHIHVGWIRRDALITRAEDREAAIEAIDRAATGTGLALVARHRGVTEIHATRSLQQVAGSRRHVANLHRRAAQDRFRKDLVVLAHERVPGQFGIAHRRPNR